MVPAPTSHSPGETAGYNHLGHPSHPEPSIATYSSYSTSPRPRRCSTGVGGYSLMVSTSEDQDESYPSQSRSQYSGNNNSSSTRYELYQPGRSQRTQHLSSQETFGTLPGTTSGLYSTSDSSLTYLTNDFSHSNTHCSLPSSYGNGSSMQSPVYYQNSGFLVPPFDHHDTSPPPPSPTASLLNVNAPSGHLISDIIVSHEDIAKYMRSHDLGGTGSATWKLGTFKCIYPGCTSTAVEPARMNMHLALHLNGKKAYKCTCRTKFGRLSEANRHLQDQKPCVVCGQSRRKYKGTDTCSRCFGATSTRGRRL